MMQNDAKNRHLGTIPQLCQAISSQLRHVSTIGKKLVKQQYHTTLIGTHALPVASAGSFGYSNLPLALLDLGTGSSVIYHYPGL